MGLHQLVLVTEPEVDHAGRAQHSVDLLHHRLGVDDVFIDVIEDHYIYGFVWQRKVIRRGADEVDAISEASLRRLEPRDVDVDSGRASAVGC
jgi:hypothetical protein